MKHDWTAAEGWGKGTAAVLGGFAVFLVCALALGTVVPRLGGTLAWGVGTAVVLCVPAWALMAGWAVLAPSGRGAWLRVGGTAAVLGLATLAAKLL